MNIPTVSEFKAQFTRDFPYGTSSDSVLDSDIVKAISQADFIVNESLFSDETKFKFAFNYLAAHYLVTNLKASSQGLNGGFSWIESSKSVGSVSQSFNIPPAILSNPILSLIAKTNYGAMYLSLVLPLTYGQVTSVSGGTIA